ncbi:hypothetical protein Y1Q_0019649 [Alligator mississippiensis]|uniref:Uncharacterized protein n=1 Tax=Alligator mississippiensis TaxID=8496 RepID=A0A151PFH3_ALLMI|nr:hypothetical protein Y1Q_0019649 [Alligator mississippiensis]
MVHKLWTIVSPDSQTATLIMEHEESTSQQVTVLCFKKKKSLETSTAYVNGHWPHPDKSRRAVYGTGDQL